MEQFILEKIITQEKLENISVILFPYFKSFFSLTKKSVAKIMQVVCTKKRGCKTSKSWMISRELSKYSKLRGHSGPLYPGTYLFKANFTCRKGWRNVKSWVETFRWCLFLETFSWISFGPNLWQASGDKRKTLIHLNFLMDSPHTHCQFWGFFVHFLSMNLQHFTFMRKLVKLQCILKYLWIFSWNRNINF